MRTIQNSSLQSHQIDIAKIVIDPKSRDDIPQILKGLQYIYSNEQLRKEIFNILERGFAPHVSKTTGRPGMQLWPILVLGILRLDLNCDYDRVHDLSNHHNTIRLMLGHDKNDEYYYQIQTIKDNLCLLTPELLAEINQVIVNGGHILLKKKDAALLHGRCDSWVVETNVHYPTDINLLLDAMRKVITLIARLSEQYKLIGWRQSAYNIRHLKQFMRIIQNKKRVGGKSPEQKDKNAVAIKIAHKKYLGIAEQYLGKACVTLEILHQRGLGVVELATIDSINNFINHATRQIDQIKRRALNDEKIPHAEKVFSIFEPHTEWVVKGKAGVPVELGVRVCILEDQYRFILHHLVMEKQTDDKVAQDIVQGAQQKFPSLKVVSFDKGFHSPSNQEFLSTKLNVVAMPRKGKLSKIAACIEGSEVFINARKKHSAVESAINALEVHGLDMCPDHGIHGFKRYVALAIVSRNVQRIGAILQERAYNLTLRIKHKLKRYNQKLPAAA